jgi:hypothetical protein
MQGDYMADGFGAGPVNGKWQMANGKCQMFQLP